MAKFLSGNDLNTEIGKIFQEAEKELIIISPFIKLHHRFKDELKVKKENDGLKITIVFGKNEEDLAKSLGTEEIEFLKQFPNIEIRYEKRLHAKYYANEKAAILTSMNLYSFSQDNNIEAGVLTKTTILDQLTSPLTRETVDQQAYEYFHKMVIPNSELLFKKEPLYTSSNLGFSKKYTESKVTYNELDKLFLKPKATPITASHLYNHINNSNPAPKGFCIRTGKEIPFNPKKPFCNEAFKKWNEFKDENYKEKYCHFSGEPTNGETSFAKPILKKNWNKAKELIGESKL